MRVLHLDDSIFYKIISKNTDKIKVGREQKMEKQKQQQEEQGEKITENEEKN